MPVAATSIAAFRSTNVNKSEARLLELFTDSAVRMTREQIAARLGIKEASVCGTVFGLVKKQRLGESEGGITASGRAAKLVHLRQEDE
jgi:hypothetical protein